MKRVSTEQVAANPRRILRQLAREGSLVITEDGHPRGILTLTSEETLLADVQEKIHDRARRAVTEIRGQAARLGLDKLTMAEIDAEIAAARSFRKRRRRQSQNESLREFYDRCPFKGQRLAIRRQNDKVRRVRL